MARDRMLKLAAIGSAAGVFSGVFGVGGGSVVVPLLILWFGYSERAATGTSLAAVFAAIAQAVYGNVDLLQGLVVGTPAVAGVVVGTGLQQRVPERTISLLFAALLVVIAIQLVIP
jgi:uncharacterized protein